MILRSPRCDGGALDPGAGEWAMRAGSDPPTWPRRTAGLDGGVLWLVALPSEPREGVACAPSGSRG